MDWIEKILDKFESFLKRAFLPSMVFYFFIIVFSLFDNTLIYKVQNILESKQFIWIFIAFSVGLSYFLSMLQQLIFDNNIKDNYETKFFWTQENKTLKELRQNVINNLEKNLKFKDINLNDYILYQIFDKNVDTMRYVDDAKTYGIIFLSFVLALIVFLSKSKIVSKLSEQIMVPCCFYGLLIIVCIFFLTFDVIKAKYRSRSIRLYLNYLNKNIYFKNEYISFKKVEIKKMNLKEN